MKIIKGIYTKEYGTLFKKRNFEMLVLEQTNDSIKGIDLSKLSENEIKELKEIVLKYESTIKKYMTSFRHFKKDKIESVKEL